MPSNRYGGFLTPENKLTMTEDKRKLNRWWKAGWTKTNAKQIEKIGSKPITGFYFDGKKDSTITKAQKGDSSYTKSSKITMCY